MNDIHRAGRKPIIRPKEFYINLLNQYETMTTRQLGKIYGVTNATICNWLKKAREESNGQE